MKSFVVFALLVAVAVAAPAGPESGAQVVSYSFDNIGTGPSSYEFETSNGIKARADTVLENQGTENEGIEVRGEYSYVGSDNVLYSVQYLAGKNGFQPQGAHLPQAA